VGTSLASEEVTQRVTVGTSELAGVAQGMEAGPSHQGWFLPSQEQALALLFNSCLLSKRCFNYFSSQLRRLKWHDD